MTDADAAICERIARFCGHEQRDCWPIYGTDDGEPSHREWFGPNGEWDESAPQSPPDYFRDGNAMCEVWEVCRAKGIQLSLHTREGQDGYACRAVTRNDGTRVAVAESEGDTPQRAVALAANDVILATEKTRGCALWGTWPG